MEEVINELKARRLAAGVSISEVARRMGTDRAKISEIENGRVGLTLKRMLAYADALGLKVTIKFE
jgi:transcriptional regulator with XRE-family HTH domain